MDPEKGKSAAPAAAGRVPPAPAARLAAGGGDGAREMALAPGFRFHPTDEELVSYYLKRKICNKPVHVIGEVDIYKNEPWELADKSRLKTRDQVWYFFCELGKKHGNSKRMNRATNQGYWKATGNDREIRRGSELLAKKKTLVFYIGRAPEGRRTNWLLHEYRSDNGTTLVGSYVLCRLCHKNNIGPLHAIHYGPFMEAEWDEGEAAIIPGEDAVDGMVVGAYTSTGTNQVEQDTHSNGRDEISLNEPLIDLNLFPVCTTRRAEDCPPQHVLNTETTSPLLQYKKRKHNDAGSSRPNASDYSPRASKGSWLSTTATGEGMTAISAFEFPLMEPNKPLEESPQIPLPTIGVSIPDPSVPPGYIKFIDDLRKEIHKVSIETETLKHEKVNIDAMLNILKSRIDFLIKENEDLKKTICGAE